VRNIPKAVETRISKLSSNRKIFEEASGEYNRALKDSGYKETIQFNNDSDIQDASNKEEQAEHRRKRKKNRKRRIIWFNPPYSCNVKSNVGKTFLRLLNKHFPKGSKLHKIFNKNTVKISYSCMKNMGSIIKSHNARINKKCKQEQEKTCNCRKKDACPLLGKCLSKSVVYKATVNTENKNKQYIGLTGGSFKDRYRNHTKSFRKAKYAKETELSKHIWNLKKARKDYNITWEIIRKSNTQPRKSGICNLCLEERFEILNCKKTLNKRSELIATCRHTNNISRPKPISRVKKK